MVDRYTAAAFRRYCALRRLSPAAACAELELFDDLMLLDELRASRAGRRVTARPPRLSDPPATRRPITLQERASWMT